jgi:hypothetical protein
MSPISYPANKPTLLIWVEELLGLILGEIYEYIGSLRTPYIYAYNGRKFINM